MIDHVGFSVSDYARAKAFYEQALAPLGYEATSQDESVAAFGARGHASLWLYADAQLAHDRQQHVGLAG